MSPELGERIHALRVAKGMTLRQLGEAVGVSVPFLSDLEHGRRRTDKLDAIEKALGAEPGSLCALDGRLPDDLKTWMMKNPGAITLLRLAAADGNLAWLIETLRRRRTHTKRGRP